VSLLQRGGDVIPGNCWDVVRLRWPQLPAASVSQGPRTLRQLLASGRWHRCAPTEPEYWWRSWHPRVGYHVGLCLTTDRPYILHRCDATGRLLIQPRAAFLRQLLRPLRCYKPVKGFK